MGDTFLQYFVPSSSLKRWLCFVAEKKLIKWHSFSECLVSVVFEDSFLKIACWEKLKDRAQIGKMFNSDFFGFIDVRKN